MTSPSVLLVVKGLDIGGLERIVIDLAIGLAECGAGVEVAVVNGRRDGLAGPLLDAGVPLHDLGGTDRIGLRAARRLARLVADPRFDVVHVHGPLPALVARLTPGRRALVTTSHTLWGALRRPVRLAWWASGSRDRGVIAVSAVVAASLPRRMAGRAQVIPHGVDPQRIRSAISAARSDDAGHPSDDTITVVAVASHRAQKNYPNLLRAVRIALDDGARLRVRAVGEGPGLDRHRRMADELGLGSIVTFEPPTRDGLRAVAGADLLVLASDYEGQPLVVIEALALGVPVVATAVGRVPDLVSPAVGRVVPPGDAKALGAALAELAGDDELRHRMSDAARHRSPSWTLDDAIRAHLALYEEIARLG
ncbi:MAG: glycosyltransferase [Acidimicrobiales bacterium]